MTNPLEGKVTEREYSPHDNYDYEIHETNTHDHFIFRRGNETIQIGLAHPHHEELQESDPKWNTETIFGRGNRGFDEYGYQHTFWDKPRGSSKPATISTLFATPGAKADVAAAIGVVVNHSIKRFGHIPDASRDLSIHSVPLYEKIVDAAKQKGISGTKHLRGIGIVRNEIRQDKGDQEREFVSKLFTNPAYKDIDPKDIELGSKTIRGLFAGRHLNKQQFTQQELPFNE